MNFILILIPVFAHLSCPDSPTTPITKEGRGVYIPPPYIAGSFYTFDIDIPIDEIELEEGGNIIITVPNGFSPPQMDLPDADGYLTFTSSNPDNRFGKSDLMMSSSFSIAVHIDEGGLEKGGNLTVRYGDREQGGPGARTSILSGKKEFRVEYMPPGGEIGETYLLKSLEIEVEPDAVSLIRLSYPSILYEGDQLDVRLIATDRYFNPVKDFQDTVNLFPSSISTIQFSPFDYEFPTMDGGNRGLGSTVIYPSSSGILRVECLSMEEGIVAIPGPVARIYPSSEKRYYHLWGDLHVHSLFSGDAPLSVPPAELYEWLRYYSGLDFASVQDHDEVWVLGPQNPGGLVSSSEYWKEVIRQTNLFYEPGLFVTLLCYEWTNRNIGHKTVCFNQGDEYVEEGDRMLYFISWTESSQPCELWSFLIGQNMEKGSDAITYYHHPASRTVPPGADWRYIPSDCAGSIPDSIEPVAEAFSQHGNSLHPDLDKLDDPISCNEVDHKTIHEALREIWGPNRSSHKVGIGAGSDSHERFVGVDPYYSRKADGNCQIEGNSEDYRYRESGLLCAIVESDSISSARNRSVLFNALKSRNFYGTTGDRIIIRFFALIKNSIGVEQHLMGWEGDASSSSDISLEIDVTADRFPLSNVQVWRWDSFTNNWQIIKNYDQFQNGGWTLTETLKLVEDGVVRRDCGIVPPFDEDCIIEGAENLYYIAVTEMSYLPIEIDDNSNRFRIRWAGEEWRICSLKTGRFTGETMATNIESSINSDSCMGEDAGFTCEYDEEPFDIQDPEANLTERFNILNTFPFEIDFSFDPEARNLAERIGFSASITAYGLKARFNESKNRYEILSPYENLQWPVQGFADEEKGWSSPVWIKFIR